MCHRDIKPQNILVSACPMFYFSSSLGTGYFMLFITLGEDLMLESQGVFNNFDVGVPGFITLGGTLVLAIMCCLLLYVST